MLLLLIPVTRCQFEKSINGFPSNNSMQNNLKSVTLFEKNISKKYRSQKCAILALLLVSVAGFCILKVKILSALIVCKIKWKM